MASSPRMISSRTVGLYPIRIGGWYGWLGTALGVAACVA